MVTKRPIDAIRDSALSMEIGSADDESQVSEMIGIGPMMYVVKAKGIYAMQLADQIDPERKNPAIPNTQQRILSIGSDHPIVARTLLTAHTLFKKNLLGRNFDEEEGLRLALDFLKDAAAMQDMRADLEVAVEQSVARFDETNLEGRNLRLPSLGDAELRCDAFAQKVGHAVDTLKGIARLFYPTELKSKWIDSLITLTERKYGADDPFTKYIAGVGPGLLFMREMRNMVEHPMSDRRVNVYDFRLLSSGQINPPSVEIVRSGEDTITGSLSSLMDQLVESIVTIAEALMAYLCNANVQPFSGFALHVFELPVDQRANPHQRMSYGILMDGRLVRFG